MKTLAPRLNNGIWTEQHSTEQGLSDRTIHSLRSQHGVRDVIRNQRGITEFTLASGTAESQAFPIVPVCQRGLTKYLRLRPCQRG